MTNTFGQMIREARKKKGCSQRELAKLISINYTYLSKLENDKTENPPSEDKIFSLAQHLDLDPEHLVFLAGRIPECYQHLLKENPDEMQSLFRKAQQDYEYRQEMQRKRKKSSLEEE